MQVLFEFNEFFALALLQSRDGNVRPARDNFGDIFLGHFFAEQSASRAGLSGVADAGDRTLGEFSLKLRNLAELDFTSFSQFAAALRAFQLSPQSIEFFFPFPLLVD